MGDERRLLLKIAHAYYIQGMTQAEIAERFTMTRQRVNKIIGSLIDEGIVTIRINGYEESFAELENKLESMFNLKQAIVTETDGKGIIEKLSAVAIEYIANTLKDGMNVGVSWGRTLAAIVQNMPVLKKENISIVQFVGGKNIRDISIMTDEITRVMAQRLGASPYFIYAPAVVKDESTKKIIMGEESIQNVFNMMTTCDMAIVGIGDLSENSTLHKYDFLSREEIKLLQEKGCVGDICFIPFDAEGKIIETDIRNRIIGIDEGTLKNIPLVVGVAGGEGKEKATLGALKTGLIDILITDGKTAKFILNSK